MARAYVGLQGIGNTAIGFFSYLGAGGRMEDLWTFVSDNGSHEITAMLGSGRGRILLWKESDSVPSNLFRLALHLRKLRPESVLLAYPACRRERAAGFLGAPRAVKMVADSGDWPVWPLSSSFRVVLKPVRTHDVHANALLYPASFSAELAVSRFRKAIAARSNGRADEFIGREHLNGQFLVGIHPGTRAKGRLWPFERFVETTRSLSGFGDLRFLVFGGPEEASRRDSLAREIGPSAVSTGDLPLATAASLLGRCRLFFGNDSAPMHLAALQGVPALVVWGSGDPYRTAPFGSDNLILRGIEINAISSACAERALKSVLSRIGSGKPAIEDDALGRMGRLTRLSSGCRMLELAGVR